MGPKHNQQALKRVQDNKATNGSAAPHLHRVRERDFSAGRERRRTAILKALRQCVAKKGFKATALNDVAAAAGMSPSHLLYYYPNLNAIVVELCEDICTRIRAEIISHQDETPQQRIDVMVEHLFQEHIYPLSD